VKQGDRTRGSGPGDGVWAGLKKKEWGKHKTKFEFSN
jgi:hypothetical protein